MITKNQFRTYLEKRYKSSTVNAYVSAIKNLSEHHSSVSGNKTDLYSVDDLSQLKRICREYDQFGKYASIGATGHNTYKCAFERYIEFRETLHTGQVFEASNKIEPIDRQSVKVPSTLRTLDWPIWSLPNEDEVFQLATVVTKYVRFLHPGIVEAIANDNRLYMSTWKDALFAKNIDAKLYLWDGSSCAFPGIRRYAGSEEIAIYRKQKEKGNLLPVDAIKLDDNDFPKQIWSFIFRGKQFAKYGPTAYSLAHLLDHKESKNRMSTELQFIEGNTYDKPLYGLYTCPTNAIYTPNSLIKPTDFDTRLRQLLFRKAESLYKDCCALVPSNIVIPKDNESKWDICNFKWAECVGSMDNIYAFLDYRIKVIKSLLD